MYNYLRVVYIVEPATSEMKALIAKDKFVREEILIPSEGKKFIFIRFSLPLYHVSSHFSLMSLSSRQDEVAKKVKEEAEAGAKVKEEMIRKKNIRKLRKKKMTMKKKEEMIVIKEEDEEDENDYDEDDEKEEGEK